MATLPDFLFDTHKRYKADTNRVAAWLVETAQKCGLTLDSQPSSSRSSGRLKGKARKEARIAGTPTPTTYLRHIITVKGFTDMAQVIAQQKPKIPVPDSILGLLRSAISLRRRCSNWFQKKATQEEQLRESTQTHSFFISVLEDVLHILESSSTSSASDDLGDDLRDRVEELSLDVTTLLAEEDKNNPYDVLYIDDSSIDQGTEIHVGGQDNPITRLPPKVNYEMETTDEELYFAIYCFFDDLDRLREFIRQLWLDYKNGLSDLITTSVTTNHALELVQQAEKDLASSFPEHDTYEKTANLFYMAICILRGEDPTMIEQPEDMVNLNMLDVAEWLYLPVYSMLHSFLDVLRKNHHPVLKPGHFGVYNPLSDRSRMTVRQRMQEDRIILFESLPEFHVFTRVRNDLPVADELTDGLRSTFADKTVPIWLAYAMQIYLDIHHVLRADVIRGFSDLQASGAQAISTLTAYFSTSTTFENWPVQNEKAVKHNILSFIDHYITHDAMTPLLRQLYNAVQLPTPEPHSHFRRHPLLCGLFQFKLYLLLQDSGIALVNAWGSVLYVAHLYEACRQGGYTTRTWPDMELVMYIHTRDRIFAGRVPKTAEESYKNVLLMLGTSAVMFAKRTRSSNLKASKKGPKGLSSASPMTDILRERYVGTAKTQLTLHTVERLLDDRVETAKSLSASSRSRFHSPLRQQWAKSHKLTVLQLLNALRDAMASEQHMLRFDYFSLHQRCLRLLRNLRSVLDDKLRRYIGPNYIENETQLPTIVGYIFQIAAETGKTADRVKFRDGFQSLMMKSAAEIVEEFFGQEGDVERTKLEKMRISWEETLDAGV